jgi:hypothetical protein
LNAGVIVQVSSFLAPRRRGVSSSPEWLTQEQFGNSAATFWLIGSNYEFTRLLAQLGAMTVPPAAFGHSEKQTGVR